MVGGNGGGNPFYVKFWSAGPRRSEIADFEHLPKKVKLTLIENPLYAFQ